MELKERLEIPEEKIFEIKRNTKKIDFTQPYKFIYFDFWFHFLTLPIILFFYILATFCRFFFGLRVVGSRNKEILRKRGCITISNHCHYFDTVFASYALFPKRLYISVVQRNYEVPIVRAILRVARAFPIPSNRTGLKMIAGPIGEALRRGYHVHFLPEGELVYLSQTIYRFRLGAFYQSYIHQVPILPMVYVFKRRRLFGKELGPNWIKMTLVFGEPIYPPGLREDGKLPKEDLAKMSETAAAWMERILAEHHKERPA
jgi:1-acyl-sn-glycerol-3-phosphate acyltransferase